MRAEKKRKRLPFAVIIIILIVVIAVSLYHIVPYYLDRAQSAQTYRELADTFVTVKEEASEKKKDWWCRDVVVALEELKEINGDVIAWIRFDDPEATGVNYPVMYSGDNETYLHTDIYGETHAAGSVFLDGLNEPDFSDIYNILYGHNMRNRTMFGNLRKFREEEFWEENQYFTLYTEGMAYRYQIFSCYEAESEGDVYRIGFSADETYREFIEETVADSLYDTGIVPTKDQQIITLSTCTGNGYDYRLVVHGVCVDSQSTDIEDLSSE